MHNGTVAADERRRNYHTLDGLRGVAAVAVIMLHNEPALAPIPVHSAALAVDLFFLLSGFVIASAYDKRFDAGMTAATFLRVRVVRLYPLYLLGFSIIAGATLLSVFGFHLANWSRLVFAQAVVFAALMLPAPWINDHLLFPLNMTSWSLFFELVFNVVHAVTYRWLRGGLLWWAVLAFGIMLFAGIAWLGGINAGVQWPTALLAIPRTGFSFFLGVGLCRLHRDGRLPKLPIPPAVLLVALLGVLLLGPDRAHRIVYDSVAVFVLFPLLLCAAVATEPRRPRVYTLLGEASYPAYILQLPCMLLLGYVLQKFGLNVMQVKPWGAIGVVGFVMLAGWIAAITFDPWARRLLGNIVTTRPGFGRIVAWRAGRR